MHETACVVKKLAGLTSTPLPVPFLYSPTLTRPTRQARKDVTQIFNVLLRRQIGSRFPTVEAISKRPQIVFATLKGCVRFSSHCLSAAHYADQSWLHSPVRTATRMRTLRSTRA